MTKIRPVLTPEEIAELTAVAARAMSSDRSFPFWVKVRTFYIFASMLLILGLYFTAKDYILELHFSDPNYRTVLGEQYIVKRLMAAGVTVIFYGYCYFRNKYFALASFGLAVIASLNLLSDLLAMYGKIDLGFSWIAVGLLVNRCVAILFFTLNFIAMRKR